MLNSSSNALIVRFQFQGNDFPVIFIYKPQENSVYLYKDNVLAGKVMADGYERFMKLIKSEMKSILSKHQRELLEAEIYFTNLFRRHNYFIVGSDGNIKESMSINS